MGMQDGAEEERRLLLDEEKEQHETRAHLPLREPLSLCASGREPPRALGDRALETHAAAGGSGGGGGLLAILRERESHRERRQWQRHRRSRSLLLLLLLPSSLSLFRCFVAAAASRARARERARPRASRHKATPTNELIVGLASLLRCCHWCDRERERERERAVDGGCLDTSLARCGSRSLRLDWLELDRVLGSLSGTIIITSDHLSSVSKQTRSCRHLLARTHAHNASARS